MPQWPRWPQGGRGISRRGARCGLLPAVVSAMACSPSGRRVPGPSLRCDPVSASDGPADLALDLKQEHAARPAARRHAIRASALRCAQNYSIGPLCSCRIVVARLILPCPAPRRAWSPARTQGPARRRSTRLRGRVIGAGPSPSGGVSSWEAGSWRRHSRPSPAGEARTRPGLGTWSWRVARGLAGRTAYSLPAPGEKAHGME